MPAATAPWPQMRAGQLCGVHEQVLIALSRALDQDAGDVQGQDEVAACSRLRHPALKQSLKHAGFLPGGDELSAGQPRPALAAGCAERRQRRRACP